MLKKILLGLSLISTMAVSVFAEGYTIPDPITMVPASTAYNKTILVYNVSDSDLSKGQIVVQSTASAYAAGLRAVTTADTYTDGYLFAGVLVEAIKSGYVGKVAIEGFADVSFDTGVTGVSAGSSTPVYVDYEGGQATDAAYSGDLVKAIPFGFVAGDALLYSGSEGTGSPLVRCYIYKR